jgi:hypothetical protein
MGFQLFVPNVKSFAAIQEWRKAIRGFGMEAVILVKDGLDHLHSWGYLRSFFPVGLSVDRVRLKATQFNWADCRTSGI